MEILELLNVISTFITSIFAVLFFWRLAKLRISPRMVCLLDFVCYKHPFPKLNHAELLENQPRLYTSPNEVENVVFEMVDELLRKTKAKVKDIRVLVCVFNGSSAVLLSSMIVKIYKFRESIAIYDLNGKGSTAGLAAITLAKQLLEVDHDGCALVVITEELPKGRCDNTDSPFDSFEPKYRPGAAILLSNRTSDSHYSKYRLMGTHSAHIAVSSSQLSNPGTQVSVTVTNDIPSAADKVVKSVSAYIYFLIWDRKPQKKIMCKSPNWKPKAWFSMDHVSGAPMVEAAERNPKLPRKNAKDSSLVLSWFGYEPNSSLWYRLAYQEGLEANGRSIPKDSWMSQMALWTDWADIKGISLVWQAIGDIDHGKTKISLLL